MVLTAIALLLVSRQQAPGPRVSAAIPGARHFRVKSRVSLRSPGLRYAIPTLRIDFAYGGKTGIGQGHGCFTNCAMMEYCR